MNGDERVVTILILAATLIGVGLTACSYRIHYTLPREMAELGYCWYISSNGYGSYQPCELPKVEKR